MGKRGLGILLALGLGLLSSTCQPRFHDTRLVTSRAEPDGVRLGDIPVRIYADEHSQRALDALNREAALRELSLRHSDSATTRLELRTRGVHGEGYRIDITRDSIKIEGEGPAGTFYAVQDLLRRMRDYGEHSVLLPFESIVEQPLLAYRGMHLDVSRQFFPLEDLERLIDLFAALRINTLHLHFTDDHGFSIELPQAKELATRGEGRLLAYTKPQIEQLNLFAAARFITLVPEIDVPGHVRSWLVARPELACPLGDKSFSLATESGVFPEVLCAGNPEVRNYVKARFVELAQLFPGPYVHLGGDEVPFDRWQKCPHCQKRGRWLQARAADKARAKDQSGSSAFEAAAKRVPIEQRLYDDFIADITQTIARTGKIPIGWDETAETENGPQVVQLWRDGQRAQELLERGKTLILSPWSHAYLNRKNAESEEGPGDGIWPLEWREIAALDWRPLVRAGRAGQVLGGAATLWTEHVRSRQEAEYLYFPRALLFAEVLWRGHFRPGAEGAGAEWLAAHTARLERFGVHFFVPTPQLLRRSVQLSPREVSFNAPPEAPGAVVRVRRVESADDRSEVTEADATKVMLEPGENHLRVATFWRGRRSEVARGTMVVEGMHPARPAESGESGCMAQTRLGRFETVPMDAFAKPKRRYQPCDAVGMLGGAAGAVHATGAFTMDSLGVLKVHLTSDDGAKLWIDGVLVVDHDGVHAATLRLGEIALAAGRHEFELRYANTQGPAALDIELEGARPGRVSLFEISTTR